MRILVTGSRGWDNEHIIREALVQVQSEHPASRMVLVHGGAVGADKISATVAQELGWGVDVYYADWETFGKAAGMIRNQHMLDSGVVLVLAFWDGSSKGTKHTIEKARKKGLTVRLFSLSEDGKVKREVFEPIPDTSPLTLF